MKTRIWIMAVLAIVCVGVARAEDAATAVKGVIEKVVTEQSEAINEIKYEAESKVLTVVFDRGTYEYSDVPAEVHQALVDSDSQGTYYRENIRGKYKSTKIKK